MKKGHSTLYKVPVLALALLLPLSGRAQVTSVVNAASYIRNASLTPDSIATIFGANLANTTAYALGGQALPTTLGGVSVSMAGKPCGIFYVSPTQLNVLLKEAPLGAGTLLVTAPSGQYSFNVTIEKAGTPGVFSFHGSGTRDGAVLNAVTFKRGPFSVTSTGAPTAVAIFATGLNLDTTPVVKIGGLDAPVLFYGKAPGFEGLQQINCVLPAALAGAGRVEIAVTAGGKTSNITEIMILPNPGQGSFPAMENEGRNREIAAIAWVPKTSLALLTDEDDDVVRILDAKKRTVVDTIALAEGAEPVAVAVNDAGTLAVIAERERGKVAVFDIVAKKVVAEPQVGSGPSSVAIAGDKAVIVNQDSDTVSILTLSTGLVAGTVPVGRGPRSVALDGANRAFVVNQDDGTISVVDIAALKVVGEPIKLGANSRPTAIGLIPDLKLAVVTEPSAGSEGKGVLVDTDKGAVVATVNVNPEKSGGSSDIAVSGHNVFFANQTGASITIAKVTAGTPPTVATTVVKVDLGARALAVDTLDNLLLVTNQGSGTVVVIDLSNNQIAGRINGVRSEIEDEGRHDDREDREHAINRPEITALDPKSAKPGATITLKIDGKNLTGADEVNFFVAGVKPGMGMANGHGHGLMGQNDKAFTVSEIQVNAAGTQLTAKVVLAAGAVKGDRLVRVETPNGDSSIVAAAANTFKVE